MRNDDVTIILAAIALLGAIMIVGLTTLIERTRPRIIYVHQGGKPKEDDSGSGFAETARAKDTENEQRA